MIAANLVGDSPRYYGLSPYGATPAVFRRTPTVNFSIENFETRLQQQMQRLIARTFDAKQVGGRSKLPCGPQPWRSGDAEREVPFEFTLLPKPVIG
ncbi:MAG: hypothetical protein E5Y51_14545 [Mesorhizobium sp.]|nr:MAG: hypothetical protein E5Y51_14545 [Mesorhizobium sp.]